MHFIALTDDILMPLCALQLYKFHNHSNGCKYVCQKLEKRFKMFADGIIKTDINDNLIKNSV